MTTRTIRITTSARADHLQAASRRYRGVAEPCLKDLDGRVRQLARALIEQAEECEQFANAMLRSELMYLTATYEVEE